jgi:mono/diheme cytochrome c family protein
VEVDVTGIIRPLAGRALVPALALVLTFTVTILLTGCTQDTAEEPFTPTDPDTTAPGAPATPPAQPPAEDGSVDVEAIYAQNCAGCHGEQGEGGGVGPGFAGLEEGDRDAAETQIRQGGGGMPAFEEILTDEEIEALAEYAIELQ